jgi:hypothetical protein
LKEEVAFLAVARKEDVNVGFFASLEIFLVKEIVFLNYFVLEILFVKGIVDGCTVGVHYC